MTNKSKKKGTLALCKQQYLLPIPHFPFRTWSKITVGPRDWFSFEVALRVKAMTIHRTSFHSISTGFRTLKGGLMG